MGKKTRKRIIKRRSLPEMLLGRGSFRCEICYPDVEYIEKQGRPLINTIYVGKRKVKIGMNEIKIIIAWCAECKRWLAKEVRWRVTMEKVDVASALSDGKAGKGKMDWLTFVCMCDDWKKYCI